MEERTGWRGRRESEIEEEERSDRIVGAAETSRELAEWCRLQQKNLSILGLLKRKECLRATKRAVGKYVRAGNGPQSHKESSWQVRQSRLYQKEKEKSCLSKAPDRTVGESPGEGEPHLGKRGGSKREQDKKRWSPQ